MAGFFAEEFSRHRIKSKNPAAPAVKREPKRIGEPL
jgi:hypothetical protein